MSSTSPLRVVVAGAGLAGLSAARDLQRRGLHVHVVEARERPGGRVRTLRDGDGVHVEAGGEFIEAGHDAIRGLASSLRVPLTRVLRAGFGMALRQPDTPSASKVTRTPWRRVAEPVRLFPKAERPWRALERTLRALTTAHRDAGGTWDTATAVAIARRSVDDVVPAGTRPWFARALVESLRGFYVAEPDELSALVLADQLLGGEPPGRTASSRITGGNDRLVDALVRAVRRRGPLDVACVVRTIEQDARGVRVVVDGPRGRRERIDADYAIVTFPPPLVLGCTFDPPLPPRQRRALAALRMGPATKVSLRFDRPWWRRRGRPRAFGSNLPFGAAWESAEEQRAFVLTLLGGATTSAALARAARDPAQVVEWLHAIGAPPDTPASVVGEIVSWESERWSRGGYAVFGPAFDPRDRRLLSAAHGRVLFAGEHTSERWQGFMNGAVESGQAAARDLVALAALADA